MLTWEEHHDGLKCRIRFASYDQVLAFICLLAFEAERINHHPDLHWHYTTLDVRLVTHDSRNSITEKDWRLAKSIIEIYARFQV